MARHGMNLGLAMLVAVVLAGPVLAADDASQMLAQIAEKHTASMAVFRANLTDEMGTREVIGPAICISTNPAVFVSLALDARVAPEHLSDFKLTPAGKPTVEVKGELLGIDPETNIAFIKSTGEYAWSAVQFARTSNLAYGQKVASIGLWPADTGYQVYLGFGYVASYLRLPELQVFVAGRLTNVGTPVFNSDGLAIGIVGNQRFMNYQTMLNGRPANLGLKSQQEASFFLPVEEFSYILENIPASPTQVRRLPWMGVLEFAPVSKEIADVMGLTRPGVMIDQIVPGQPAEKAGLANRDVIVAFNGKPIEELALPELTALNFQRQMARLTPGQQVSVTIVRGQETKDVTVTLEPLPTRPEEAPRFLDQRLGMLLREKIAMDQYIGLAGAANVPGLVVVIVGQDTPAGKAAVQPNDVISAANNQPIQSVEGYKQIMQSLPADQPVNLLIRRGSENMTVTVQPAPPTAAGG